MEVWPLWGTLGPQNIPMHDTYQKRDLGQAQEGEAAPHRFTFHSSGGKSVPQRHSDFGHHHSSLCLSPGGLFEWLFCQWRWKPNLIPKLWTHISHPWPFDVSCIPTQNIFTGTISLVQQKHIRASPRWQTPILSL